MESVVTLRAVTFGVVILLGVCLPILGSHYSRIPDSRPPSWLVALLAVALWAIPASIYLSRFLAENPEAVSLLSADPSTRSPVYEVSPTVAGWVVEPLLVFIGAFGLGTVGFVVYEILATRWHNPPTESEQNGR